MADLKWRQWRWEHPLTPMPHDSPVSVSGYTRSNGTAVSGYPRTSDSVRQATCSRHNSPISDLVIARLPDTAPGNRRLDAIISVADKSGALPPPRTPALLSEFLLRRLHP